MTTHNNSQTAAYTPHALPGSPEYKARVAEVTMRAIDAMPREWRELVHEFGYVDVYRAWKRRWTPAMVRHKAKQNGGAFFI